MADFGATTTPAPKKVDELIDTDDEDLNAFFAARRGNT